ncbi:MAG: hypothetical protein QXX08_05675 [Candidatus Bathyarchaeia archaeon]
MSRFRPVTLALRWLRSGARYREYARFYGSYVTITGKIKRFSFSVKVNPRLNNRVKYRRIVTVCNSLLDKMIPEHKQGDIFNTFAELLYRTRWFRVRRLRNYQAGMVYER